MKFTIFILSVFIFSFFFSCTKNVTENEALAKIFKTYNISGDFALYDVQSSTFQVHNFKGYRDSGYVSFKAAYLLLSLIGVETGAINDETSKLPVSDKKKINLLQAVALNNDTFFNVLAHKINPEKFRFFLDTIAFGSYKKDQPLTDILNTSTITSDQLLGFIKKIYAGNFIFQPRTLSIVLKVFNKYSNTFGDISYINLSEADKYGLVLGWLEIKKRPYFFVLHPVYTHSDSLGKERQFDLLLDILTALNLFLR